MDTIPTEIVHLFASHLEPRDTVTLATCSKQLYSQLASENLLWWKVRNMYVTSEDYQSQTYDTDEGDFLPQWAEIDYRMAVASQMSTSGKLDKGVFSFLYRKGKSEGAEYLWTTGEILIGAYLTRGWVDQAKVLIGKYYLAEEDDSIGIGKFISDEIGCFVQGDHLELFKVYDRKTDTDYIAMLRTALQNGAPKMAGYLVNVIADENEGCLCSFFEAYSQGILLMYKELSANKYKELPAITCRVHREQTLDIAKDL